MLKRLVSVIVPTKNSAATLVECLESIRKQTYPHIELIVVDNFSTDDTQAIARRYTDKVFAKGPERTAQRNYAAAQAVGEYVVFIDSDMKLSPNVIAACVSKMSEGIKGIIIPEESFGEGFWAQCKKLERSFYIGLDSVEAARFFRKNDFDAVHGYNECLVAGEDWDLSDRIEMLGALVRIPDLIYHNEGRINLVKTLKKKYYYSQEASDYLAITSAIPTAAKRRSGGSGRYIIFFMHPVKLLKNPVLGLGMLFMKACEFAVGAVGLVRGAMRGRRMPQVTMPHDLEVFPSISFILPTYNAEKYLAKCLNSIMMQDYPKDKLEVLLIDGGSDDRTLAIAREYPVRVLHNEKRIAEYAKTIGIHESKGDYFILIDSDNEIVEKDWLRKMVRPMLEQENLFGVESPLSHDSSLSSLNRYFARMRIADPLAAYLASSPKHVRKCDGYDVLEFADHAALITGANGFLWNKDLVLKFSDCWEEKFEEANFSTLLHEKTGANYAIPYNASVRHYYSDSFFDFIAKRKKIAGKMKNRIKSSEYTWLQKIAKVIIIFYALYLGTLIGPIIEAAYKSFWEQTLDYLWHPLMSATTIYVYASFYVRDFH